MRKLSMTVVAVLVMTIGIQAQSGLSLGANVGLPIGDAGDVSTFSIGFDSSYLFEVSEKLSAGPAISFTNAFGDTFDSGSLSFDYDDIQFLPVAAAARFMPAESFSVGADIGYAVGINDGNDGGFYYRPMVGYNINDKMQVSASYRGISLDGGTWSTINAGFHYIIL